MDQTHEFPDATSAAPDWVALADSSLTAFLRLLADDPTPDAVAEALAHGPLAAFGPTLVALGFIDTTRQVLATEGLYGADTQVRRTYAAIPLDADLPATACYRTNTVVTAPASRMAQDYPLTARFAERGFSPGASIWALPIRYRSAVIAVLGLELSEPAAAPWLVRSAVATVTGPLAMWAALRQHTEQQGSAPWTQRHPRSLSITDRQRRIIALVRQGLTNPQIAEEIGYSIPTVKVELARLSALLGATDRTDLATKAARAGL